MDGSFKKKYKSLVNHDYFTPEFFHLAFDFNYPDDLKQREIEEDEQQTPEDEDEEEPLATYDDEDNHFADFIRDVVHPDLSIDDIVADFDI